MKHMLSVDLHRRNMQMQIQMLVFRAGKCLIQINVIQHSNIQLINFIYQHSCSFITGAALVLPKYTLNVQES